MKRYHEPLIESFLKADFEQCQQWMRHYDSSFSQMISFLYSGYAAIITAVYVLYSSFPAKHEAIVGASMFVKFYFFSQPHFPFLVDEKSS